MGDIDDPLATFGGAVAKRFTQGTHRVTDPDVTLQWLRPLLPVLGITRVANVTGLDYIGIPVVMVCRPNSRSLSVAQGKGWTLAAAKASGIMEAVEGHHSQHITLPLKYASYDELCFTHEMADIARLPQVRNSRFHPDFCLHWIEGRDLATGTGLWVPYEMVHTNYTLPTTIVSGCFLPSTNGLASGNHKLEAISHGLCELVESDSRALWWLLSPEAKRRTVLDLTTVDDAACLSVLEQFEQANMTVNVWNLTSDLGMACFYCSLTEAPHNRKSQAGRCGGVGCHPARGVALMRALTEAAQSRLTLISGSRDDISPHDYRATSRPVASVLDGLTLPLEGEGQDFRRIPSHESAAIDDDVRWELGQLRNAGFTQVVVVDLTKAEFEIPVVRVVVPGLEGLNVHRQYCPGERAIARIGQQA